MKVVCDVHIPYIAEALRSIAEVVELEPEAITAEAVRDADGLIIRTRTKADSTLLDGSRVQFIATATIGYDHIDTAYCAEHNIHWVSCPGCNAQAVCDYIEEAFEEYRQITNTPKDKSEKYDDGYIRMMAIQNKIAYMTTIAAAKATVAGIKAARNKAILPKALQEYLAGR